MANRATLIPRRVHQSPFSMAPFCQDHRRCTTPQAEGVRPTPTGPSTYRARCGRRRRREQRSRGRRRRYHRHHHRQRVRPEMSWGGWCSRRWRGQARNDRERVRTGPSRPSRSRRVRREQQVEVWWSPSTPHRHPSPAAPTCHRRYKVGDCDPPTTLALDRLAVQGAVNVVSPGGRVEGDDEEEVDE